MKPAPLLRAADDADVDVVGADDPTELVALLFKLPPLVDVEVVAVFVLLLLLLSGKPPANAFCTLTATTPTTIDLTRWRICCAPQKLLITFNDLEPYNFNKQLQTTTSVTALIESSGVKSPKTCHLSRFYLTKSPI